jgi:Nucleotidyltransferase/DNA polymerase involved in DNA repair
LPDRFGDEMAELAGESSRATADRPVRKIIHVDMDAFFASVEQRDNPSLRGKPVAVGSPQERGVVAAASYEARKFGVRSAMPSVVAARKCKHLVFVPPRFDVYRAVSAQIHAVFAEYTALVEPLSLDEAYLDVTDNLQGIPLAVDVARAIRARIFEKTGLTASAGISYCKFLAKMASGMNKPDGQFVIPPERGPAFMESLPVEKFHGVGPATAAKMHGYGIVTGADLKAVDLPTLTLWFGKHGAYYHDLSRGIDSREVRPDRERKSVGAEDTFAVDIEAIEAARTMLSPLVEKVWAKCESLGLAGRTATLKVKFADFTQITRSKSLPGPIPDRNAFVDIVEELLGREFPPRLPVRLLGVSISSFEGEEETGRPEVRQLSLEL